MIVQSQSRKIRLHRLAGVVLVIVLFIRKGRPVDLPAVAWLAVFGALAVPASRGIVLGALVGYGALALAWWRPRVAAAAGLAVSAALLSGCTGAHPGVALQVGDEVRRVAGQVEHDLVAASAIGAGVGVHAWVPSSGSLLASPR